MGQGCNQWLGLHRDLLLRRGSSSAGVLRHIFSQRTWLVHLCACHQLRLEARSQHGALQTAPAKTRWTSWSDTLILDCCVPSAAQEGRLAKSSLHICWLKCFPSCPLLCQPLS